MSGVYIHIPYCHSKCSYCDFYSTPNKVDESSFVDCLVSELQIRRDEIDRIGTVYLGGGTPSILTDNEIKKILNALQFPDGIEVTMEVNPEDVEIERVRRWKSMGVNRISMGVQSFSDSELKIIGRRHDSSTAIRAIKNLREGGINNFNIDLIYALPGQTLESWKRSLIKLLDLAPNHFSAYMLSYEPRTRLNAMLQAGKITAIEEEDIVDMYNLLTDIAGKAGYEHYEISNFAKPGWRSIHNSNYWNDIPYLGLGPGAHSFDGKVRRVNPSDLKQYIRAISSGIQFFTIEEETKTDMFNNLIITALRTKEGLNFKRMKRSRRRQFLCDAFPYFQRHELVVTDNNFSIPENHWLIADAIM